MNRLTRQVLRLGGSVEKTELCSIVTRFGLYVFETFLLGNVGGLETELAWKAAFVGIGEKFC